MTALVLGLVIFIGMHSVRIISDDFRTRQIEKVGLKTWRAMYAAVAIVGIVLIVAGYGAARGAPPVVWYLPSWLVYVATLLTIPAFILMAASFTPGSRIRNKIGHPFMLSITFWALAHLIANGMLADVLLFGVFLVWSFAAYVSARRRDRKAGAVHPTGPPTRDVIAVIGGLVAWAVFALWLHRWLFGVAPLQMVIGE
jgi:uncharacterized membrane protein